MAKMQYTDSPRTPAQRDQKYEAESDLRTLIDAGQIKKDKPRYERAMDAAKAQAKALAEVKE